jgi:heme exporter protein D
MNWSRFFSMGGYAFYVWGSYLLALIVMGGEVLLLVRRRKTLLEHTNDRCRVNRK